MVNEAPEQQVEAASPEVAPAVPAGKPNSVTTTVWVPKGPVSWDQLRQAAIQSVRDAIPVVFSLDVAQVSSKSSTRDKVEGREYTLEVNYTPRGDGKAEPVDVDKIIKGLEAPRLDAFHPGDPDFGKDA